jgi:hypothetical protein
MILVRDKLGKIHCAKCNQKLGKDEVVKDRLVPVGVCNIPRSEANYVGVCVTCHKERLKTKLVLPSYWKFLGTDQKANLGRTLIHNRSLLMSLFPEKATELQKL